MKKSDRTNSRNGREIFPELVYYCWDVGQSKYLIRRSKSSEGVEACVWCARGGEDSAEKHRITNTTGTCWLWSKKKKYVRLSQFMCVCVCTCVWERVFVSFRVLKDQRLWSCLVTPTAAKLRFAICSFHTSQGKKKKKRLGCNGEIQLLRLPKSPFSPQGNIQHG